MNESHTSPEAPARRTIFSTERERPPMASPVPSRDQPRIIPARPPSSQSSDFPTSVVQQSFTSDTSVIDRHWLREQQRLRDIDEYRAPSPATLFDRSGHNQVGGEKWVVCCIRISLETSHPAVVHTWHFSFSSGSLCLPFRPSPIVPARRRTK